MFLTFSPSPSLYYQALDILSEFFIVLCLSLVIEKLNPIKCAVVKSSASESSFQFRPDTSDSSWSGCSQTDVSTVVYTAEQLMNFLLKTKGQRDVRVVDYFPDKQQFVRDGTFWMREGEIPKPEYYRLRQKLRST